VSLRFAIPRRISRARLSAQLREPARRVIDSIYLRMYRATRTSPSAFSSFRSSRRPLPPLPPACSEYGPWATRPRR
jgi:hypothetical protein